MANMALEKVTMPEQDPKVRARNFEEVTLGYTKEMAMEEASRRLNCKHKPCVSGCPVGVRIPEFIAEVAKGDFEKSIRSYHIYKFPSCRMRTSMPSGKSMRRQMRKRHQGRTGCHRTSGKICCRLYDEKKETVLQQNLNQTVIR